LLCANITGEHVNNMAHILRTAWSGFAIPRLPWISLWETLV